MEAGSPKVQLITNITIGSGVVGTGPVVNSSSGIVGIGTKVGTGGPSSIIGGSATAGGAIDQYTKAGAFNFNIQGTTGMHQLMS